MVLATSFPSFTSTAYEGKLLGQHTQILLEIKIHE